MYYTYTHLHLCLSSMHPCIHPSINNHIPIYLTRSHISTFNSNSVPQNLFCFPPFLGCIPFLWQWEAVISVINSYKLFVISNLLTYLFNPPVSNKSPIPTATFTPCTDDFLTLLGISLPMPGCPLCRCPSHPTWAFTSCARWSVVIFFW